jgi:hypothetical protein
MVKVTTHQYHNENNTKESYNINDMNIQYIKDIEGLRKMPPIFSYGYEPLDFSIKQIYAMYFVQFKNSS